MAKFFERKASKVWVIVTSIVLVLVIAINIAVNVPMLYRLISLVLGRERPVYKEGSSAMYESSVAANKEEAFANANAKNVELCEEGFVLLKNENSALPMEKGSKISIFGKNSVNLSYGGSGSSGFSDVEYTDLYASLKDAGV